MPLNKRVHIPLPSSIPLVVVTTGVFTGTGAVNAGKVTEMVWTRSAAAPG